MGNRVQTLVGRILIVAAILVCGVVTMLTCCIQNGFEDDGVRIVSWNVQNLCDGVDNGVEYSEYTSSGGWTDSMYKARLRAVVQVLSRPEICNADIIVLNEVENESVVEDIMNERQLANRGFCWYACCGEPSSPIRTAVISRIPILRATVHSVEGARPILQVSFDTEKGRLFLLAVHAKSKVDGDEETASLRRNAAEVVARIADGLIEAYPQCTVVAAGDFNESHLDRNMMADAGKGDAPDDVPLKLLGTQTAGFWYSFWLDSNVSSWPGGSYNYHDMWEMIDNILVTSTASGKSRMWVTDAGVMFSGDIRSVDGHPYAWNRELLSGISDHLPVYICLE